MGQVQSRHELDSSVEVDVGVTFAVMVADLPYGRSCAVWEQGLAAQVSASGMRTRHTTLDWHEAEPRPEITFTRSK